MAIAKPQYGSSQDLTISLDGLANGSARQCTAVDNTTTLYQDALVRLRFQTPPAALGATPCFNVYIYSSPSVGGPYTDNLSGTDSTINIPSGTNMRLGAIVNHPNNPGTGIYYSSPFSVAQHFGGVL